MAKPTTAATSISNMAHSVAGVPATSLTSRIKKRSMIFMSALLPVAYRLYRRAAGLAAPVIFLSPPPVRPLSVEPLANVPSGSRSRAVDRLPRSFDLQPPVHRRDQPLQRFEKLKRRAMRAQRVHAPTIAREPARRVSGRESASILPSSNPHCLVA